MSFNEKLIETVRDYPVLYDSAHMDYRDTKRKDNIWIKISEKLCKYDTSPEICKKRWKQLRDQFAKCICSRKRAKSSSSAAVPLRGFAHYQTMSFLLNHMKHKPYRAIGIVTPNSDANADRPNASSSNAAGSSEEEGANQQVMPAGRNGVECAGQSANYHAAVSRKRNDQQEFQETICSMMRENPKPINSIAAAVTIQEQPRNEYTYFGNIVATMLDKLPPAKAVSLMTSILQLLGEQMSSPEIQCTEPNEDEIFMVSMAKDMQKITNERTRRRLKRKIFELTAEAIEED